MNRAKYDQGENKFSLTAKDVGIKGMVIYEASGEGFSETRKMILVE